MFAISMIALFMMAIGWPAMRLSEATLSEFEAQTLPEISTALTLAEGVAQLAAIAPYTAESGRPFQLQSEAKKIKQRFYELSAVADTLADTQFRSDIFSRLAELQTSLNELISLVEEELFIREDSLALQFQIRALAKTQLPILINSDTGLSWILDLIDRPKLTPSLIIDELNLLEHPSQVVTETAKILHQAHQRLASIQERKSYLLISVRAKSEQLSHHVSQFVGGLQKKVSQQRQSVADVVTYGQRWTLGISALLLLGLARLYLYSRDITYDLGVVTAEMSLLAQGRIDSYQAKIQRNDEIGTLADTFDVFRQDAIRRQEMTAEMSKQKELLETIFNNINDGLSVFSSQGLLMAWNPRYETLFSFKANQLRLGMPIAEVQALLNKQNPSVMTQALLTLHQSSPDLADFNQDRYHQSKQFERHFHSGKVIEFRSQPMPEGGFVTLYSDLTDKKNVEQQLHQAQKMDMLGQLTGGVAHDFNNLLAAIMGNLEMLADSGTFNEYQQKYLDRAVAVSEKSRNLVQRLLAFSRRQPLFPEATQIDELIEGMLDLVDYSAGNNIKVVQHLHCPDAFCLIDASQLENALLNLALNSRAAMPEGGELSFKTSLCELLDIKEDQEPINAKRLIPQQQAVPAIMIEVMDTGLGISAELIPRIIEPFFTTKPIGKGSGLGLSSIYGFVKQSGGELEITSEPGFWTKVRLTLPLMKMQIETRQDDKIRLPLRLGQRVWLVEDDMEVANVLADQLQSLGLNVSHFDMAEDVLDMLEHDQADLILSDVNLAGEIDGISLAHQINCPILLMSGLPKKQLEQNFNLLSTDNFIQKPFNINTLKEIFQLN
jgi:signal transduction histidine kinase/CheY-like chemotaxis protein